MASSEETDVEIGISVLRNPQKHHLMCKSVPRGQYLAEHGPSVTRHTEKLVTT